jgi:predicted nucleic acid-binding protein
MAWVIDTCVLIDVLVNDAKFCATSTQCLEVHFSDGLIISPIIYVELAPQFAGNRALQDEFLDDYGIIADDAWTAADTKAAHALWSAFAVKRKTDKLLRRPVADVLIAAFAARFQGLITRNVEDFRKVAPTLRLVDAATFSPAP